AIALQPDYADAYFNRGIALKLAARYDDALASFDRALVLQPDHAHALSAAADCTARLCDWERFGRMQAELRTQAQEGNAIVSPFVLLNYSDDAALHLTAAKKYARDHLVPPQEALWRGSRWRNAKVRIAYVSPDFRAHPVGQAIAHLIELHDRNRFE